MKVKIVCGADLAHFRLRAFEKSVFKTPEQQIQKPKPPEFRLWLEGTQPVLTPQRVVTR